MPSRSQNGPECIRHVERTRQAFPGPSPQSHVPGRLGCDRGRRDVFRQEFVERFFVHHVDIERNEKAKDGAALAAELDHALQILGGNRLVHKGSDAVHDLNLESTSVHVPGSHRVHPLQTLAFFHSSGVSIFPLGGLGRLFGTIPLGPKSLVVHEGRKQTRRAQTVRIPREKGFSRQRGCSCQQSRGVFVVERLCNLERCLVQDSKGFDDAILRIGGHAKGGIDRRGNVATHGCIGGTVRGANVVGRQNLHDGLGVHRVDVLGQELREGLFRAGKVPLVEVQFRQPGTDHGAGHFVVVVLSDPHLVR
mmetsp:Transcript_25606/g.70458  ORF Transcript_25606/g.70458 Transcript_25606/m.70458 type:complete len:307 (+) Transcript_25606:1368-2288(+)